jgi:hypothetical protein
MPPEPLVAWLLERSGQALLYRLSSTDLWVSGACNASGFGRVVSVRLPPSTVKAR